MCIYINLINLCSGQQTPDENKAPPWHKVTKNSLLHSVIVMGSHFSYFFFQIDLIIFLYKHHRWHAKDLVRASLKYFKILLINRFFQFSVGASAPTATTPNPPLRWLVQPSYNPIHHYLMRCKYLLKNN